MLNLGFKNIPTTTKAMGRALRDDETELFSALGTGKDILMDR
jgi:hypothetical protein